MMQSIFGKKDVADEDRICPKLLVPPETETTDTASFALG
jgi:hypothetical protein